MLKSSCIDYRLLFDYCKKKLPADAALAVRKHIDSCQECSEALTVTQNLIRRHQQKIEQSDAQATTGDAHISENLKIQFFQGTLAESELADVQKHLKECVSCAAEFKSIIDDSSTIMTAEERRVLREIEKVEVEDRLAAYTKDLVLPKALKRRTPLGSVVDRFGLLLKTRPVLSWSLLAIAVITLSYWCAQRYTTYQVLKTAEAEFRKVLNDFPVADGELRPTGGFAFSLIGNVRSGQSDEPEMAAFSSITEALKRDPRNQKLNHLLGTVYLLDKNPTKAEERYLEALSRNPNSARIHNDLALVYSLQQDEDRMFKHLNQALQLQPRLLEAKYNLAMALEATGDSTNAVANWEDYTRLDADSTSIWNRVARSHLVRLRRK